MRNRESIVLAATMRRFVLGILSRNRRGGGGGVCLLGIDDALGGSADGLQLLSRQISAPVLLRICKSARRHLHRSVVVARVCIGPRLPPARFLLSASLCVHSTASMAVAAMAGGAATGDCTT